MLRWTISRQPLRQAVSNCFCQGNRLNKQNTLLIYQQSRFRSSKGPFKGKFCIVNPITCFYKTLQSTSSLTTMSSRTSSTSSEQKPVTDEPKLSNKDKLKRAVKDYGVTVIVFHISLSLTTLGLSYLFVSSGVDVTSLLSKLGVTNSELATGASTFVVAYALHKVFAPVRISITLGATPFIVRYLRGVGILKPPKTNGQ